MVQVIIEDFPIFSKPFVTDCVRTAAIGVAGNIGGAQVHTTITRKSYVHISHQRVAELAPSKASTTTTIVVAVFVEGVDSGALFVVLTF